jgi:hypothetical protein
MPIAEIKQRLDQNPKELPLERCPELRSFTLPFPVQASLICNSLKLTLLMAPTVLRCQGLWQD